MPLRSLQPLAHYMSSAALSGIYRDTLFHFDPAKTIHGSFALKVEITQFALFGWCV